MLSKIFLIVLVSSLILGFTSCQSKHKIDAFECGLITTDNQSPPQQLPLDQWYWFCLNQKTGEKIRRNIKDSERCLRDPNKHCKFSGTDVLEREKIINAVKDQCNPNGSY